MTWSPEECAAYWPTDPLTPVVDVPDDPPEVGRLLAPSGEPILIAYAPRRPFGFRL